MRYDPEWKYCVIYDDELLIKIVNYVDSFEIALEIAEKEYEEYCLQNKKDRLE